MVYAPEGMQAAEQNAYKYVVLFLRLSFVDYPYRFLSVQCRCPKKKWRREQLNLVLHICSSQMEGWVFGTVLNMYYHPLSFLFIRSNYCDNCSGFAAHTMLLRPRCRWLCLSKLNEPQYETVHKTSRIVSHQYLHNLLWYCGLQTPGTSTA